MKNKIIGLIIWLFFSMSISFAQSGTAIPTKGVEFWLGFMHNGSEKPAQEELNLFISSPIATSGVVTIPGTAYTQAFTVAANITTTVTIPNDIAEVKTSEVIEQKGVFVETQDTVSLFAINYQDYSSDGSKILPYQSLGTDYLVVAYETWDGSGGALNSELLIVATEDDSEIEITPSAVTQGGRPIGVPYIVNLDAGEVYQIKSQVIGEDLTGTRIKGTEKNGSCRLFAVFSGNKCANIPVACKYCDHVFEQNFPVKTWGNDYFSVPYQNTTSYFIRVIASENNTIVRVDNGAPQTLSAGQYIDYPNSTSAMLISGNRPIAVVQFAKGSDCAGNGDPAMLFLNSTQERIYDVIFSTVQSNVITQHNLNIITETIGVNQLVLDGAVVNPSVFTQYPANPQFSYGVLSIPEGSHTLESPSGFTAYVYGTGKDESYSYSVGSFSPGKVVPVDSILCSSSEITIGPPKPVFSPVWTSDANPGQTLATTQTYTFTPTGSDVITVTGNSFVSGCEQEYKFSIGIPTPPIIDIVASEDTISVCKLQPVTLDVGVSPAGVYDYEWSPVSGVDKPSSSSVVVRPIGSAWYKVKVSSNGGCSSAEDSIFISVIDGNLASLEIESVDLELCKGESTQLNTIVEQFVMQDNFDSGVTVSEWTSTIGATTNNSCGSFTGDALYFNGTGTRSATTKNINTSLGGTIRFVIKIANGVFPCDDVDFGEDIVLEYSINGGSSWLEIQTLYEFQYDVETFVTIPIPDLAKSPSTLFRWRQISHSGLNQDNWILDNVSVSVVDYSSLNFNWSPTNYISSSTVSNPTVNPEIPTVYTVDVLNNGCLYTDSVFIDVGTPFTVSKTPDTVICNVAGIVLNVLPDNGVEHTISWAFETSISDTTSFNPTVTPTQTTRYFATVRSKQGCLDTTSIQINVGKLVNLNLTASDSSLCSGNSSLLVASLGGSGMSDNFDGGIDLSQWSFVGGVSNTSCGSVNGEALYFAGTSGSRNATTIGLNTTSGGTIDFSIKFGSGSGLCEDADSGEDVVLEYSIDGFNWILINRYDEAFYTTFTSVSESIPIGAQTSNTQFRWRQVSSSGSGSDIWVLDEVSISGAGSSSDYTFSWTPQSSLATPSKDSTLASPLVETTYTVLVTEKATGCVLSDSITIKLGGDFAVSTSSDTILCSTSGINISVTDGAGPGATYNWSPGISVSDSTISTPLVTPTTTTTYYVEVTPLNGCSVIDSVTISVASPITLNILASDTVLCNGDSTLLVASLSGATNINDYTIDWSPASTLTSISIDSVFVIPLVETVYTAIATEILTGCTSEDSIQIEIGGDAFSLEVSNDTVLCSNVGVNLSVTDNAGVDATYNWIPGISLSDPNIANPLASPTASTTYFVEVTSMNGCTKMDSVEVLVAVPIDLNLLVSDSILCKGDSTLLIASLDGAANINDFVIEWSPTFTLSSISSDSVFVTPVVETTYKALVTEKITGCTYVDSIEIGIEGTAFTLVASNDTALCSLSGIEIGVIDNAGEGVTYNWTPALSLSDPTIGNPIATPTSSTIYYVEVTSTNGCIKTDSVEVIVSELIDLNTEITDDTIHLCYGEDTLLVAKSFAGLDYTWIDVSNNTNLNSGPVINDSTWLVFSSGLYVYQIDSDICSVISDTIAVEFHVVPNPTIVGDTTVCSGATMENYSLIGTSVATTFLWQVTGGAVQNPVDLDNIDVNFSTSNAELTIEEQYILPGGNGVCLGRDTLQITIMSLPDATMSSEDICLGDSSFVSVDFVSGIADYTVIFNIDGAPFPLIDKIRNDTVIGFKPTSEGLVSYSFRSITDGNGCGFTPTSVASINVYASPNIDTIPVPALCLEGSEIDVMNYITNGIAAGYTFGPSNLVDEVNMFDPKIAGLGTHDISIEYSDPNTGCGDSTGIEIKVKGINATFPNLDDYCFSDGVFMLDTISGISPTYSDPKYEFVFSAPVGLGSDGLTFDPSLVGSPTYNTSVMITMTVNESPVVGENSCIASDSSTLYVSGPPTISFPLLNDRCTNDGVLVLDGGSHDGVFTGGTYSGNGVIYNSISGNYEFDPLNIAVTKGSGNPNVIKYEYGVGVNCYADSNVTIIVNDTTPVALNIDAICLGETPVYQAPSGFIGGVWNTSEVDSSVQGGYNVSYMYTNMSFCSSLNEGIAIVNDLPVVNFTVSGDLCESNPAINLVTSSLVTISPLSTTGKGGVFSGIGVTDPTFDVSLAGKGAHTLKYTYTDDNDCINTDSAIVTVVEEVAVADPVLKVSKGCEGELMTVFLDNHEDYKSPVINWSGALGSVGKDSLTYESVTFKNGDVVKIQIEDVTCFASTPVVTEVVQEQVSMEVYANPALALITNDVICSGSSKKITAIETTGVNVNYSWKPTIVIGNEINVSEEGIYYAIVSNVDFEGCRDSVFFNISVVRPEINAYVDSPYIKEGESVTLSASHTAENILYENYKWIKLNDLSSIGKGQSTEYTSSVYDLQEETFIVEAEVVGLENCVAIDTITVSKIQALSVPYLFSPNDDGINDVWLIENLRYYDKTVVKIFNRWGMEVRYLDGEKEEYSWDGKNKNGGILPDGVYYYIISGAIGEESVNITGYVTIVH